MLGVGNILSFLMGPGGRVFAILLAFFAWTAYQRIDATRDCKASQVRKQIIEAQRQVRIAQKIADNALDRANKSESQLRELEEESNAIITDLQGTESRCNIPRDVRERLLKIH